MIAPRLALLLAMAGAAGAASAASARDVAVVVFKDGRSMQVQKYEQQGAVTYVTGLNGAVNVVRTDLIDFAKTERATVAARRGPTPPPATPRKISIVEAAREAQQRRGREEEAPAVGAPLTVTPLPTEAPVAAATPPPEPPVTIAAVIPTPSPADPGGTAKAATPAAGSAAASRRGLSPLVLYGGAGAALAVIAAGVVVALRRRGPAQPPAKPGRAAAATVAKKAVEEDLLTPAFADDAPAEELVTGVGEEAMASPGQIAAPGAERKSITDGTVPEPASSSVLETGGELQVRIQQDVYTCPDLETLRRWVEEGRVIENSEVLAPDGSWLMAGSIPDLEQAFERRRETLGY